MLKEKEAQHAALFWIWKQRIIIPVSESFLRDQGVEQKTIPELVPLLILSQHPLELIFYYLLFVLMIIYIHYLLYLLFIYGYNTLIIQY